MLIRLGQMFSHAYMLLGIMVCVELNYEMGLKFRCKTLLVCEWDYVMNFVLDECY